MKLTIYRILSFLLSPIALLFSICVLLFIRAAFDNPTMFLPLFLIAAVSIYTFTCLNFLIRGIDGKKFLGKSSKDWIKVNAIVSLIFGLTMIAQCIVLISHPNLLSSLSEQAIKNSNGQVKASTQQVVQYMQAATYFFLVYAIVLCIHIVLTFQYLKPYNYLFKNENAEQ